MLRPERLVGDPPAGHVNRITGTTTFTRYLGSIVRYDFTPEGARTPLLGEAAVAPTAAVAVNPEHIRLLDA
jgi:putative spermidine/putrescine transport system ATP-binding protein